MAKSWTNGVMILDSEGQGFQGAPAKNYTVNADGTWVVNRATLVASTQTRVTSITVDPSAGSWVVLLSDAHGNAVFSAKGAAATGDVYKGTWLFDGVVATTLTNITRVVLSTEAVEY